MSDYRTPRFWLRQVVKRTGVGETSIRSWLTREQLSLDADGGDGRWRLFSERDCRLISIAHRISRFGLPVAAYARAAEMAADAGPQTNAILSIWHDGETWRAQLEAAPAEAGTVLTVRL